MATDVGCLCRYHGAMPIMANVTILNGMSVAGEVVSARWEAGVNGDKLDVRPHTSLSHLPLAPPSHTSLSHLHCTLPPLLMPSTDSHCPWLPPRSLSPRLRLCGRGRGTWESVCRCPPVLAIGAALHKVFSSLLWRAYLT